MNAALNCLANNIQMFNRGDSNADGLRVLIIKKLAVVCIGRAMETP